MRVNLFNQRPHCVAARYLQSQTSNSVSLATLSDDDVLRVFRHSSHVLKEDHGERRRVAVSTQRPEVPLHLGAVVSGDKLAVLPRLVDAVDARG